MLHDLGLAHQGLDREGIVGLGEIVVADTVLFEEFHQVVAVIQGLLAHMDGLEQRAMDLLRDTEQVRRVEGTRVRHPAFAEDGRHVPNGDVVRRGFLELLHGGKEGEAVGTAVPEHLDHFHLVRRVRRLRRLHQIVLSGGIDAGRIEHRKGQ